VQLPEERKISLNLNVLT